MSPAKPAKSKPAAKKATRMHLAPEHHRLLRIAAGIAGESVSVYCGRVALEQARKDIAGLSLPAK